MAGDRKKREIRKGLPMVEARDPEALQNSKSYSGDEVNKGTKGAIWNVLMIIAIIVVAIGAALKSLSMFGAI